MCQHVFKSHSYYLKENNLRYTIVFFLNTYSSVTLISMIEKGPLSIQNSQYRTPLAVIILFILAAIHVVTHVFFITPLLFFDPYEYQ